ncbi:MAG TPA: hypothetical protein VGI63_01985 [Verrucomicrobiae bacterium]|jgi:hypothetical protein
MRFFQTTFFLLALAPAWLRAQVSPQLPPGMAAQLMVQQPAVEVLLPATISAAAEFDPPVVRAGEKTFYRVKVGAPENSIEWPDEIYAPPELAFGAAVRGQLMQPDGVKFNPLTAFVYEVTAPAAGKFTVSNFVVQARGQRVEIPEANLEVLGKNSAPTAAARELGLEVSETNLFFGQPFRVRVLLPAALGNQIEALRDVQFNGGGFLTDKLATRQSVETVNLGGELKPAFVYETVGTPMAAGPLKFSAQAFTAGREFSGPISISGQVTLPDGPPKYVLLVSEPLKLNVRPLPAGGELPGFTGAMGKFLADKPQLSTNRLRVGEPVHLKIAFHGAGNLTRFVPPEPPRPRAWQIIADKPPSAGFTLIPLTDEANATPAIPFCSFDPLTGKFIDLTIPPLPVTVTGESLPTQLAMSDEPEKNAAPVKLGNLAASPGKTVASLRPLQLRGWFVGVQLLPVISFILLRQWDRRRRFLEAHPEIVRRRRARRDLRREKIKLQKAAAAGDAAAFGQHAVDALKIACAPHFPAHPQALVGGDVLEQLDAAARNGGAGETVRKIFAAADAQFASVPQTRADLLALQSSMEAVLQTLEEKL